MKNNKGRVMTKEQLQSRLVRINASKRIDISGSKKTVRRDMPASIVSEDEALNVNDFFEFDKELQGLESAASQVQKQEQLREVVEEVVINDNVHIASAEEIETSVIVDIEETTPEETVPEEKQLDSLVQEKTCEFTKEDGSKCKRFAPKKSSYCSVHRKQVNSEDQPKE